MPVTDLRPKYRNRQHRTFTRRHLVLSVLALSLAVVAMTSAQNSSTAPGGFRVRKSVTALTVGERRDFVEAVLALKRARSPYDQSLTYYDQFVRWHKDRFVCHSADHANAATMMMVHTGPMFLPWHREFLRRFEDALREVSGKNIAVPYWDWTDRESVNPDNPRSAVGSGQSQKFLSLAER
ncbi:MAG: tyrosinase family protein, partial [Acidobacteria bacterium Pan2503]|nr:tyrosinase family protein [Candidatus Acidoferrum panamensis]